jgi:hypothetical protein
VKPLVDGSTTAKFGEAIAIAAAGG